jgi:hypothetical protein
MDESQRQKLAELFCSGACGGDRDPGRKMANRNAAGVRRDSRARLLFIMGDTAEKFENLRRRPEVTVMVDTHDIGDVSKFQISRSVVQGIAGEVAKGVEWDLLKDIFLRKNPFEAPFFGNPALRLVRVKPKRISYTGADMQGFKTETT